MSLQNCYNDFCANLHLMCPAAQRADAKFREAEDKALYYGGIAELEKVEADKRQYRKDNPCGGWILSDFDTWHECPCCYDGQGHPEYDEGDEEEVYDHPLPPEAFSHPVHQPDYDDDLPF